jgi:predicted metalloprotease
LKDELAKCKTVKEVNAYWVKNFSAKGKQTTDAELELFTNRKQEINNE